MTLDDVKVYRIHKAGRCTGKPDDPGGTVTEKSYSFAVNDATITFVNPPQKKAPSELTAETWWRNIVSRYGKGITAACLRWDDNGVISEDIHYGG